jgi:hypothetical protein
MGDNLMKSGMKTSVRMALSETVPNAGKQTKSPHFGEYPQVVNLVVRIDFS